jgi:hypothetical protein
LVGQKPKFDLKEEESKRNHPSSSTATSQNASYKQESSLHPDESRLT